MRFGLCCGGLSFHTAPVEIRERVSFLPGQIATALSQMRSWIQAEEAVLLSTCNRVDFFARTLDPGPVRNGWVQFLRSFHNIELDVAPFVRFREERSCVEYLFRVAAGMESMVIGETEILGQLKQAYGIAKEIGMTGPWLNRLFQSAFSVAKECRSSTFINRGGTNVGSVAADLAEKLFGSLQGRIVLLVGTGTMAERTAAALELRGAQLVVLSSRNPAGAEELADRFRGRTATWAEFSSWAQKADVIISSTSAPHYVIGRERIGPILPWRRGRPLFLIDLAVPRNIDPSLHLLDDVYLYNIDDLKQMAEQNLRHRHHELERCSIIIQGRVEKFMQWAQKRAQLGSARVQAGWQWT
jgi:glutamyl-tRNA reductase